MSDYKLKNISAEQFLVAVTPWPLNVFVDVGSVSGYSYQLFFGGVVNIFDGDYIVGENVWRQEAFEAMYEAV